MSSQQNRLRHTLFFVLRAFVVVGILWYVIRSHGGLEIWKAITAASPVWVLAAAVSFWLSIVAGAQQWNLLLRYQGIEYGYGNSYRTYYSGMFLNNFLPTTVGGDALRVYEVQKRTELWGKALAATFFDRLFGFSLLSVFSLFALSYLALAGRLSGHLLKVLVTSVALVASCFAVGIVLLLSRRIAYWVHRLLLVFGMRRLDELLSRIQDVTQVYRFKWKSLWGIVLLAALVQILRINVHWFSALGLGCRIEVVYFYCFIPIIALSGVIPLNVGGWGIPQSLGAFLYSLPGVLVAGPAARGDLEALAASLAFLPSVIGMVVMLMGGFYFLFNRTVRLPKPQ